MTRETSAPALPPFASRGVALTGAVVALLAALGLGVLVVVRGGAPFPIDQAWMDAILGIRTPWGESLALLMNDLGGNVLGTYAIPLGIVIALVWQRKMFSAGYFVVAALGATLVVQIVKHVVARARPREIVVHADFGSFPSGHTSHAAVLAVVAFVFLPRLWVAIAGSVWVLLMAFSRTYLGAHWLSDTLGGALVGASVAVLVLGPFAQRVALEWGAAPPLPERSAAH